MERFLQGMHTMDSHYRSAPLARNLPALMGLLNVGGTREQLVEVITQIAVYAGFPRAINAALAAKDVLTGRADTHQGHHAPQV